MANMPRKHKLVPVASMVSVTSNDTEHPDCDISRGTIQKTTTGAASQEPVTPAQRYMTFKRDRLDQIIPIMLASLLSSLLALLALLALLITPTQCQQLASDPGTAGPPLEVVHLFHDQFPTGFAISHTGRMFSSYPAALVAANIGGYTLAELTANSTETPYPNADINTPPMGRINTTTTPPSTVNSADRLISVQGIAIDGNDTLWLLDIGRVIDHTGTLLPPAPGGPKLVAIDLATDTVAKTITFPTAVAGAVSYLNDLRIDLSPHLSASGHGIAYITDSSADGKNGLVVVDLGTGDAWRRLDTDFRTQGEAQHFVSVWGEPSYKLDPQGNPSYDETGADGIALSADGATLFWSVTGSRNLFAVPTAKLRDRSPNAELRARQAVQSLGQKGVSDGIDADDHDVVYCGNFEQNGLSTFDAKTGEVEVYVRDPRIGWTDAIVVGWDGYVYFNENQLWRTPGYAGGVEQSVQGDRTVRPFPLFRVPTLGNGTKAPLM
ncbi:MAG: hypothetical protein Q9159_000338 [Coniocarpon cinnabarinum]